MDERYYVLGGLGLLLIALLVYLVVAIVRYRSAVRRAARDVVDEGEARYLGAAASGAADPFAAAPAGHPGADGAPGSVAPAETARPQVFDFDLPKVRHPAEPPTPPVAPPAPEPAPQPEPAPVAPPAPEPEPTPVAPPGYSLADELERLMAAAEQPAPLLTADEHASAVSGPTPAVDDAQDPAAAIELPGPLHPEPSLGQALSTASGLAADVAPGVPASPDAAASHASPAVADPVVGVHEYALVSPVELHFTGGGGRIGVRPGTRSFAEFKRLADILLQDLRSASDR